MRLLKISLLLLILSLCKSVSAQDTTGTITLPSRVVLKFSPLAFLEFDPMAQVGLEYRIGKRRSLQAEAGYGWAGLKGSAWGSTYQHRETWRIRTEMRKYSGRFQTNKRKNIEVKTSYPLGNYWAMELFWKEIQVLRNWTEMPVDEGGNAVGDGIARQSPVRKTVYGVNLKIGRQFPLSRRNDRAPSRVLMDVYAGVGLRAAQVIHSDFEETPGYEYRPGWLDRFIPHGWRGLPGMTAGIRIGYATR